MLKGDTSIRQNIQDILCPFTDWYCTQGANSLFSHRGSEANDIRGLKVGVKYPYYAPVDVKCVMINKKYAFVWWQSINKVRYADGTIDYVTFLCGHDETIDCYIGQVIKQGKQIGNMGAGGNATGVHCHIEVGRGKQSTWIPNSHNIYCIPQQIPLEKVFFMNHTNILLGKANWRYLDDVKVEKATEETSSDKYLNLSASVNLWRIYSMNVSPVKGNECGTLNPKKFNGLSYRIKGYTKNNVAIIETRDYGNVQIYIGNDVSNMFSITNHPLFTFVK